MDCLSVEVESLENSELQVGQARYLVEMAEPASGGGNSS